MRVLSRVVVCFIGVVLTLVPVSFAQDAASGIGHEAVDPIRSRAREGLIALPGSWTVPSSVIESSGSGGVSTGPSAHTENNGLEIEGEITYESRITGSTGESAFSAERIMNYRSTPSGFLRLQLWATKTYPVFGGSISFYDLGYVDMNPISGSYYYENMMTSGRTFNKPPDGTYYISLVLLEYNDGSYRYTDIRTFDDTWTIGGTAPSVCSPTSSKFCAQNSRFSVSLWAKDQRTGKTDTGHVMLTTGVYGMFAFPVLAGNTTDPQVFVKVLDGRVVNGKWWVFCSTLTDVEFKITVTDHQAGQSKVYHKLPGSTASTFDTGAF